MNDVSKKVTFCRMSHCCENMPANVPVSYYVCVHFSSITHSHIISFYYFLLVIPGMQTSIWFHIGSMSVCVSLFLFLFCPEFYSFYLICSYRAYHVLGNRVLAVKVSNSLFCYLKYIILLNSHPLLFHKMSPFAYLNIY